MSRGHLWDILRHYGLTAEEEEYGKEKVTFRNVKSLHLYDEHKRRKRESKINSIYHYRPQLTCTIEENLLRGN